MERVKEPYDSSLWTGRTEKPRREVIVFSIIVELKFDDAQTKIPKKDGV